MFTLVYARDGVMCRHQLAPGDTIVGRAPLCDLTIEDPSISRRHVRFRVHGDHCRLADLGGRNGTFVNGEPITEAELRDGDTVVLGRVAVRVERATAAPVALSDNHSLIETRGTVYRRVDAPTQAGDLRAIDPVRLLALLTEISKHLVRWRPLPEVLEQVTAVALDSVPAERAFLLLIDEQTGEVVPRVSRSRAGPLAQATISRTIVRRTIDERLAILAADAQLDPALAEAHSVRAANVRSFMSVPLWNESQVIGVMYVDSPRSTPLSTGDLDVLQALSAYAAVAIEQARLTGRVLEETRHRERLQRYHSSAVVERILGQQGDSDVAFLAEERDVTILFADIVGFTTMAEKMAPSEVAQVLNRCFAVMCDAVFAQEGTLDKFIGDAVLAVFGAPLDQPDHATRAARAALEMVRDLGGLGMQPPIRLRVALNSGRATVGDIGSPRRREYTVLGDVVNTCSRLQSYACEPGKIVVSAATRERLEDTVEVRPLGPVTLRGRDQQVELFELVAGPPPPSRSTS